MYRNNFFPSLFCRISSQYFSKTHCLRSAKLQKGSMDNLPCVLCQIFCMHSKNIIGKQKYKIESGFAKLVDLFRQQQIDFLVLEVIST